MAPSDAAVEGLSGAVGGIVATVATYPLMTVNTLQAIRSRAEPQGGDVEGRQQAEQRRSTLAELAELVRTGGWRALFSGLEASLLGTAVSQGIYFYLYAALRRAAVRRRAGGAQLSAEALRGAPVSVSESLLVAALAGWGNVLLTNPIWMVATRMQAQGRATRAAASVDGEAQVPPGKPGIVAVARQVYGEYGLAGFWNGTAASLLMVANPTLQYALYEWLAAAAARWRQRSRGGPLPRLSSLEVFALSAVAKAGATLATYPMLNIKTRLHTARRGGGGGGVLAAALDVARTEGPSGLYRGLHTKIVQSVLAAALLFAAKERITAATRDALDALAAPPRGGRRHGPRAKAA